MYYEISCLRDLVRNEILIAINMCQIFKNYSVLYKLCFLLGKFNYITCIEASEELSELTRKIFET